MVHGSGLTRLRGVGGRAASETDLTPTTGVISARGEQARMALPAHFMLEKRAGADTRLIGSARFLIVWSGARSHHGVRPTHPPPRTAAPP